MSAATETKAGLVQIRDVSLFVDVIGRGQPLLLMHGGPGLDHHTLLPLRRCADQFTLIFYDHRCNGRSAGAPVTSMTWDNLTADAEALREQLGFESWAVLGHSFGGNVALESAGSMISKVARPITLEVSTLLPLSGGAPRPADTPLHAVAPVLRLHPAGRTPAQGDPDRLPSDPPSRGLRRDPPASVCKHDQQI